MYPISQLYADSLKLYNRTFVGKANVAGVEYDSSVVVGWSIDNMISKGAGLELGTAIPSKLVMTLRMRDEVPSNAKIIPYLALTTSTLSWEQTVYSWDSMDLPWLGGLTEWLPLGEFYVDSRERVNDTWVYTCYDKLVWADVPYISSLSYPATMRAVWDEICGRLGYTSNSSVVINSSYTIPVAPTGYSMRQVLGWIAGANAACLFVGKDGSLRFKRFTWSAAPVFEFGQSDYYRIKQTNPVKTFSRLVVTYDDQDDLSYTAGAGDDNHTLEMANPLMTQAMTDAVLASINGLSYVPIEMDAKGFPQLDQGDTVSYAQAASLPWEQVDTAWQDTDMPWDGVYRHQTIVLRQTMNFKGGLKMRVESPSVSAQQSEFVVQGSLTQQVAKINQTAVREGKRYYGVMVSKADGFTVTVEGTNARAVFNADELSFYDDAGDRALWFDIPSHKFKFNGDLEAAGGTFSGNLSAAGGTFAGTLQGVDGIFKGQLQAASGTFSGDLSAAGGTFKGALQAATGTFSGILNASTINSSTINGGSILGTTITGSTIQTKVPGNYPRAAITTETNLIGAYGNSSESVEIRSFGYGGSPDLYFRDGTGAATMSYVLGGPGLYMNASDKLTLEFNEIRLRGYNGVELLTWDALRLETGETIINKIASMLAGKASSGASTGSAGPYNCGITVGTMLAVAGGGAVQWMGVPAHSHTQV